ncbi:carbamoyl phosphate synthase-like protein [Rubripirellula obstinata]|uniref:Carbamoyl phosphate synthase-like protein n=1 Tax=Rubripirellula obstinata TaxID=406547 RepID=A0A5B1CIV2_9BACT|nr:ATP-grasp domain-containing protein [Rubripirellula obstinata]KAA1259214.1 carbamoyl phosphate synthase-like protein [Rubripirellula obstinata]
MRIFVGEYVVGGGLADLPIESIPASLRREGTSMLRALVADLAEFAEVVVLVDPRMIDSSDECFTDGPIDRREFCKDQPLWPQWIAAAEDCDAALIIAPESDGALAQGVAMLRAAGIDVVAGSGDFLRTASDKLLTAKKMIAAGVSHPLFMSATDRRHAKALTKFDRFVVKPRDGCGTKEIRTFDCFDTAKAELHENDLLQAWMPGRAVSISLIASSTQQVFLPAVSQQLDDNSCEYAGGQGPLDDDAQRRLTNLAMRAIEAMPPTARGFIGFDMLLGKRSSEDCVIEINPRLTTSYVGLRRMIHGNLAARFFDIETGPVACCTPVNSVKWAADGQVWVNDAVAEMS